MFSGGSSKKSTEPAVLKLTIVGDASIGKTCLILEYIYGEFIDEYIPTKADAYRKGITLQGEEVTIDILDTAGQEDYQAVRDGYLKHGDGYIIAFDLTNRESFESVRSHYENVMRVNNEVDNVPVLLVGNKADLTANRLVTSEEAAAVAQEWNVAYIETSAKTKDNVDRAFSEIFIKINDQKVKEVVPIERGGAGAGSTKSKSRMTREEEEAVRADHKKSRVRKFYKNLKKKCTVM